MTIGGQTANPARIAQLDSEFRFPARPAINTAETQTAANTVLSDMSCMGSAYAPAVDGAVPDGTHRSCAVLTPVASAFGRKSWLNVSVSLNGSLPLEKSIV